MSPVPGPGGGPGRRSISGKNIGICGIWVIWLFGYLDYLGIEKTVGSAHAVVVPDPDPDLLILNSEF